MTLRVLARNTAIATGLVVVFLYIRGGWDDGAALILLVIALAIIGLVSGPTVRAVDRLLGTAPRALAWRGLVAVLGVGALVWPMGAFLRDAGYATLGLMVLFAIALPAVAVLVAGSREVLVGALTAMAVPGSWFLVRYAVPLIPGTGTGVEWSNVAIMLAGAAILSLGVTVPVHLTRRRSRPAASVPTGQPQ